MIHLTERQRQTPVTERQRQVLRLLADGATHVEIGVALGISPRTAKAHCDVLRAKFGVDKKRQIAPAARDAGIEFGREVELQR